MQIWRKTALGFGALGLLAIAAVPVAPAYAKEGDKGTTAIIVGGVLVAAAVAGLAASGGGGSSDCKSTAATGSGCDGPASP